MKALFHYTWLAFAIWISAIILGMLPAAIVFEALESGEFDIVLGNMVLAVLFSAFNSFYVPLMLVVSFYAMRNLEGTLRSKKLILMGVGVLLCGSAMAVFGVAQGNSTMAIAFFPIYAIAASVSIWFWLRISPPY